MKFKPLLSLTVLMLFSNCIEKNITDSDKAYSYWANAGTDSNIEVINGQYWESAHWTYEYIIFLELKVNETWWVQFSQDHNLIIDSEESYFPLDSKQPKWFSFSENFLKYKSNTDFDQGSRYFYNPNNQTLFIYEIQL